MQVCDIVLDWLYNEDWVKKYHLQITQNNTLWFRTIKIEFKNKNVAIIDGEEDGTVEMYYYGRRSTTLGKEVIFVSDPLFFDKIKSYVIERYQHIRQLA